MLYDWLQQVEFKHVWVLPFLGLLPVLAYVWTRSRRARKPAFRVSTAALFTAHYRGSGDAADALARTTSSVFDLLERTHREASRELLLVESQEAYAHPGMQFEVRRLR